MDKEALKTHLEGRKEQLNALIKHLETRGDEHPQYGQLDNCKIEFQTVISQLDKLKNKT
ncbi:hypothetical protein QUB37_03845 [Microcoleus sp. AT3-A2]|uniref:hypothetical protein n=1 Tax=Microcoleus sp. AT3-A2 TaxID=2818610 RepID=UPI002FD4F715